MRNLSDHTSQMGRSSSKTSVAARRRSTAILLVMMLASLLLAAMLGVAVGAVSIPPRAVLELIMTRLQFLPLDTSYPDKFSTIIFSIRMPRVVLMAITGATLAAAGATYQGLFRNPLADPYLVGVAAGAGLGATLTITSRLPQTSLGLQTVPLGAFLGGIFSVGAVIIIARAGRTTPITTILLAGVAIGSFATALTTFLMLRSPDGLWRAFNWMLGGYAGGGWKPIRVILPYFITGSIILQINARTLNILQLGEEQAQQLGIHIERVKFTLLTAATLMTAASVAFGGLIGFVGLIVPHILRLLSGPDYRRLIPLSFIGGGSLMIVCDLLARTVIAPQEVPVGIITALAGTPFFIFLLRRIKRSVF